MHQSFCQRIQCFNQNHCQKIHTLSQHIIFMNVTKHWSFAVIRFSIIKCVVQNNHRNQFSQVNTNHDWTCKVDWVRNKDHNEAVEKSFEHEEQVKLFHQVGLSARYQLLIHICKLTKLCWYFQLFAIIILLLEELFVFLCYFLKIFETDLTVLTANK